jgi:hypothetical protein
MPGYEQAHEELERVRRARHAAARDFVIKAANGLLAQAVPLAPIETGTLRGSAVGPDPETGEHFIERDDYVEAMVSFNTPYAARQHEELEWKHPRGGQAKYLEQPYKALMPRWERALAAALERAVREA